MKKLFILLITIFLSFNVYISIAAAASLGNTYAYIEVNQYDPDDFPTMTTSTRMSLVAYIQGYGPGAAASTVPMVTVDSLPTGSAFPLSYWASGWGVRSSNINNPPINNDWAAVYTFRCENDTKVVDTSSCTIRTFHKILSLPTIPFPGIRYLTRPITR